MISNNNTCYQGGAKGGFQVLLLRYTPSQNYVKITGHSRSCASHTYHDRQYNQRYTEVTTDE